MALYCPKCNSEVQENAVFCWKCGYNPDTAQAPSVQPTQPQPAPPQPQPAYQQPVYQQHPQQIYQQPVSEPRNALGTVALILGIIGVLFGFVPFTGFIAFGLGVTGVILALSARGRLKRGTATNRKVTVAGGIVSLIATGLGIFGMVIVFTAVDKLGTDLKEIGDDLSVYSQCIEDAQTPEQLEACGDTPTSP